MTGVFDAYREEAQSAGFEVGSEWFGLRRPVSLGATIDEARESAAAARLNAFIAQDQRFSWKVADAGAEWRVQMSEEKFITGTPQDVAAGIRLAIFNVRYRLCNTDSALHGMR